MITTETLVWIFFFAVIAAIIYSFGMQYSLSVLAKRLIDSGTDSKEKAKTLAELEYKNLFAAAITGYFAGGGSTVSRAIEKIGGQKKQETDKDLLFVEKEPVKYYLPEENVTKNVEKHIYEQTSPRNFAILLVILVIVAYIASGVINFLGNFAYGLVDGDGGRTPVGVESREDSLLESQEELNRKEEEMKKLEEEIKAAEQEALEYNESDEPADVQTDAAEPVK